jgi:hypothetical protein
LSRSDEAAATDYHGWNHHSEGDCHVHHHRPFLGKKVKMAEKTGKERNCCSYLWKTTKGSGEIAGAGALLHILPRIRGNDRS